MSQSLFSAYVVVRGRVQGVGFRYFAQSKALEEGLTGWVRNKPDGSVEGLGVGTKDDLERWIQQLRQGPPLSRVEDISVQWSLNIEAHNEAFEIVS